MNPVKRADVDRFFTKIGIEHAVRVEFSESSFTVWSWVRDKHGIPAVKMNSKREPQPLIDVRSYDYEDV